MLLFCITSIAASPTGQNGKAMVPFKFQSQLTQEVTDNSNLVYFKDLTSEAEKERLASKGIKAFHSFNIGDTDNKKIAPTKTPMREGEQTYTLTVNLKYDKEEVDYIEMGLAYSNKNSDYYFFEWPEVMNPDEVRFIVPKGEYDIDVLLITKDMDFIFLTAQEINVDDNCETLLDADDATVEITWNALLPDGEQAFTDIPVRESEDSEIIDYLPGNSLKVVNDLIISNTKHNISTGRMISPLTLIYGDRQREFAKGNIKTIPNNDYEFNFYNQAIGIEGGYVISLMSQATQSQTITNDINNYVTIKPEFARTPHEAEIIISGDDDNPDIFDFDSNNSFCLNFITIRHGVTSDHIQTGILQSKEEKSIKNYINVCQDPKLIDQIQIMPIPTIYESYYFSYNTTALPINTETTMPQVLSINNASEKYRYDVDSRNVILSTATNPWLSFSVNKPHVWNYGCPVLVFSTEDYDWGSIFDYAYIGRLGENRTIDRLSTTTSVSVDGDIPSDEILEYLQWGMLPENGKMDFEFIDTNVAIDGIPGKNVAHVNFDLSRSDWQPPTLQLVRFVDTEGNFIDHYAKGAEGVIEFYGGDFKYNQSKETYANWFSEEPAEVKVEYAPYGTDSFLPLEVENIPERDFMPGFGTYYQGSLAAVDRKSENGWFDVRITLTDASGNYQEQILSPAFKIEECVGVETITAPEIGVTVANGNISIFGCENPVIEIYSTDGILLKRISSKNIAASEYSHGIYIVNVIDGNKRAIRKICL